MFPLRSIQPIRIYFRGDPALLQFPVLMRNAPSSLSPLPPPPPPLSLLPHPSRESIRAVAISSSSLRTAVQNQNANKNKFHETACCFTQVPRYKNKIKLKNEEEKKNKKKKRKKRGGRRRRERKEKANKKLRYHRLEAGQRFSTIDGNGDSVFAVNAGPLIHRPSRTLLWQGVCMQSPSFPWSHSAACGNCKSVPPSALLLP